jgi:hypothetical protein
MVASVMFILDTRNSEVIIGGVKESRGLRIPGFDGAVMISASEALASDWIASYPPPRSLSLDQEAVRVYERAYYIGAETEKEDDPPISFSTVLAALLLAEDDAGSWFSQKAKNLGPKPESVFREKNIGREVQQHVAQQTGRPQFVRLSSDKQLLTLSARTVLQNAENWSQRVGGSDIGVRHLIAAYLINPPANHRLQLNEWGLNETAWRPVFFDWVAKRFTWEIWGDVSQRPAPSSSAPVFEQVRAKGSSLSWHGDTNAMKILEQAARDHGRRDDKWLRLQTLILSLIETAEQDETVREAIRPLWNAVEQAHEKYLDVASNYYLRSNADQQSVFARLDISPRVLTALDTARELASFLVSNSDEIGEGSKISPLHLAGGLLSRRVDGEEEFTALGIYPQSLRAELVRHAKKQGESDDIWREVLGMEETLPVNRPLELNSDEPEAVIRLDESWQLDPLRIRPDVEAFASLLASKTLEPPLSIGLFGPWGSGKTTFLKRLKRAVDQRAKAAKKPGSPEQAAYVGNVVHIEFNAWHYAEDALVSSLIDAIFRGFSGYIKDDQVVAGKKWRDQKFQALESTQRKVKAAEERRQTALATITQREDDLAKERKNAAERATNLRGVISTAWNGVKADLLNSRVVKDSGVLESFGDVVNSAEEFHARIDHVRTRPGRMLGELGWVHSLIFAGLLLVLPTLVAWIIGKTLQTPFAGQILSSLGAVLSVIGLWARAASRATAGADRTLTRITDEFDRRVSQAEQVKKAEEELTIARARAETAAAGLEAARTELTQAQTDAANAALPLQLLRIVTGRNEDMSYQKELTTLSLARADLDALSRILRDQSAEASSSVAGPRTVDRVILYIDDLDRCRPEDVVRVLQVTHMLLAFELFVVVVAVDARWVEEALKKSYPWLKGSDQSASEDASSDSDYSVEFRPVGVSPQDYLEKIFQIAFWLEPMTTSKAADFIGSLVRNPFRDRPGSTAYQVSATHVMPNSTIGITALELDYMRFLAGYVGPSPRRVKRLVNAYRLIKARMSDAQLSSFLTDRSEGGRARSGPYQIVIALLVIGTGAQSEAAEIMHELAAWDPKGTLEDVIESFKRRKQPEWTVAARVIETLVSTQRAEDVSELRGWAGKVARFLLHGLEKQEVPRRANMHSAGIAEAEEPYKSAESAAG